MELDLMEAEEAQVHQLEERIADLYHELDSRAVLQTLPGVGPIIAAGVLGETGTIDRLPS